MNTTRHIGAGHKTATLALLTLVVAALTLGVGTTAVRAASVIPAVDTNNPDCSSVGLDELARFTFTGQSAGVEVTGTKESVSWTSGYPVAVVIVKGGSLSNVYDYRPAGATGDSGLRPPVNPNNGRTPDINIVTVCVAGTGGGGGDESTTPPSDDTTPWPEDDTSVPGEEDVPSTDDETSAADDTEGLSEETESDDTTSDDTESDETVDEEQPTETEDATVDDEDASTEQETTDDDVIDPTDVTEVGTDVFLDESTGSDEETSDQDDGAEPADHQPAPASVTASGHVGDSDDAGSTTPPTYDAAEVVTDSGTDSDAAPVAPSLVVPEVPAATGSPTDLAGSSPATDGDDVAVLGITLPMTFGFDARSSVPPAAETGTVTGECTTADDGSCAASGEPSSDLIPVAVDTIATPAQGWPFATLGWAAGSAVSLASAGIWVLGRRRRTDSD